MDDLAGLFADADPARTPLSAPLEPRDEAILASILATPRTGATKAAPQSRRLFRRPMAIWVSVASVLLLLVIAAAGLSLLRPGGQTIADYPWYPDEAHLVAASDAIVRGTVIDTRTTNIEGISSVVVTVRVQAVDQGPMEPGDDVEVMYPASTEPEPIGMSPGDDAIFFLRLSATAPASILSPAQGSYLVRADGTVHEDEDNPIRLSTGLLERLGIHR